MPNIELIDEEVAQSTGIKFLDRKVFENSFSKIGRYQYESLVLVLRDDNQNAAGGLHGQTGLGWLYADVLWVAEDLRDNEFGTQLLKAAEKEAGKRGSHSAYLYSYSFQQPEFYKKLGYKVFGRLDDFPDGYVKYFMKKSRLSKKTYP
jgi:ribosomal protein S18 acetylase RimI-like enzyme